MQNDDRFSDSSASIPDGMAAREAVIPGSNVQGSPMGSALLVIRSGRRLCGISITDIEETMRPQPIEPLPNLPPFVLGASVIRGVPIPVVSLRALLLDEEGPPPTRLVSLRVGTRRVALLVDGVIGVQRFEHRERTELAPLLHGAASSAIDALERLDRNLFTVLSAARIVPDEVFDILAARVAQ